MILASLRVFILMFIYELLWVRCVSALSGRPIVAAAWSVALFLVGTLSVLDMVGQPYLLIPAAAGAFFGTFMMVWHEHRNS